MEKFEDTPLSTEEKMKQLEAQIAEIESLMPRERNDTELIGQLRVLKQKLVQMKVDMAN
jgi:hypothetical protein